MPIIPSSTRLEPRCNLARHPPGLESLGGLQSSIRCRIHRRLEKPSIGWASGRRLRLESSDEPDSCKPMENPGQPAGRLSPPLGGLPPWPADADSNPVSGWLNDVPRETHELTTQDPEYGLSNRRINPHRCVRTSSEIHATGERELRISKGFRCRLNCLTPRHQGRDRASTTRCRPIQAYVPPVFWSTSSSRTCLLRRSFKETE